RLFLRHLAEKFDGPDGTIDTSVFDPNRIMRMVGTLNMRGPASAERPHRYARLLEVPAGWTSFAARSIVPAELLGEMAKRATAAKRPTTVSAGASRDSAASPVKATTPRPRSTARKNTSRDERLRRARAWLRATPGAVSGSGGQNHTFYVCCRLLLGFDLAFG